MLTLFSRADSVLTWISQKPVSAGESVVVDVPVQRVTDAAASGAGLRPDAAGERTGTGACGVPVSEPPQQADNFPFPDYPEMARDLAEFQHGVKQ
ncbi:hypothetical protein [Thermobifida cellulosilytica]|uniref:hypothetical protein n=1 Tax=Thermobifida cellulosilytica TaxID=144786 RepID=UPI0012EE8570|nr:hypothetical protein [Thermobifida cellulosilytica]